MRFNGPIILCRIFPENLIRMNPMAKIRLAMGFLIAVSINNEIDVTT